MDENPHRLSFTPDDPKLAGTLFGQHNRHLRQIEQLTGVRASSQGATAQFEGPAPRVAHALNLLQQLATLVARGYALRAPEIEYAERILSADPRALLADIFLDTIAVSSRNKAIAPKSLAQKAYVDAIRAADVVFGIGPAGTGKPIWPWPWR